MGWSLASFVTPVSQEKYYLFLTCSQKKQLHFQEKSQEKSGKTSGGMCMNTVIFIGFTDWSEMLLITMLSSYLFMIFVAAHKKIGVF